MRVVGVMSGTSLDGIDVAIVDVQRRGKLKPVAFRSFPYQKSVRAALLSVSNTMTHTATISRLNFLLGELYADAIRQVGPRYCILSSDLGQAGNPLHPDGLLAFFAGLEREGISPEEIALMSKTNPAKAVGLGKD